MIKVEGYSHTIERTESSFEHEGSQAKVYGISISSKDKTHRVDGISSNQSFVDELLDVCRSYLVAPAHLLDVVEDYLSQHL